MKRKAIIVFIGVFGFIVSSLFSTGLDDCPSGCIITAQGFPFNVLRDDYSLNYAIVFMNLLVWVGFAWIVTKSAMLFLKSLNK